MGKKGPQDRFFFKLCCFLVALLTVVLSVLTGTSYISLRWLSRRLCCEWAWMIWLKVFLLSCLGGRAGGWLSIPSGDLRKEETGQKWREGTRCWVLIDVDILLRHMSRTERSDAPVVQHFLFCMNSFIIKIQGRPKLHYNFTELLNELINCCAAA